MFDFFNKLPNSIENIGLFVGILLMTIVVAYFARRLFNRYLRFSSEKLKNDPTNYKFLGNSLTALIYTLGLGVAITQIKPLHALASSMLAGAGILAVAVGVASQSALGNLISGIFIIIFKPFRVHDRLKVKDIYIGEVEDITLRHTVLKDPENKRIIIPNAIMNSEIIVNADFDDAKVCRFVEIGVAFTTDIDLARAIMQEEISKHYLFIDGRDDKEKANGEPLVKVKVVKLDQYTMVLRAWAWAKNSGDAFDLYCDALEILKKRFDTEGIEIPYPKYNLSINNA